MRLPRPSFLLGTTAVLSVMLNLFFAGNLFGLHFRPPPPPNDIEVRLASLWREMPAADQIVAKAILSRHHDTIIAKLQALRPANQEAGAALRTNSFDADASRHAFDTSNQRLTEFRAAIQDAVVDIAGKISPEGRKHLHVPGGGF